LTEALGALVSRLANNWGGDQTEFWITFGVETFVGLSSNDLVTDVVKDTFSSFSVTRIFGTNVVIVTDLWDVQDDTSVWLTEVSGTCVVVIARSWGEHTVSSLSITRVSSTWIVIVTNNRGSLALSGSCITSGWEAFVFTSAGDWSEDASFL
jgi:hypothetical protein